MEMVSSSLVKVSLNNHGKSFMKTLITLSTKKERYLVSLAILANLHIMLPNKNGAEIIQTFCNEATYTEYKGLIKKLFDHQLLNITIKSQVAVKLFPSILARLRPKYRSFYYEQISDDPNLKLLSLILNCKDDQKKHIEGV